MKDFFQCVMNSQQFFDFFVDVPFSYWTVDDRVIVTGRPGGTYFVKHSPMWEYCQAPSWENLSDDPDQ